MWVVEPTYSLLVSGFGNGLRPVNQSLDNPSESSTSNAFPFPFRNAPAAYTSAPILLLQVPADRACFGTCGVPHKERYSLDVARYSKITFSDRTPALTMSSVSVIHQLIN